MTSFMKSRLRVVRFVFFMFLALSCASRAELEELRNRVAELERRVDALNADIGQLQKMVTQIQTGGYVTAVAKKESSYTISFNDGSTVLLNTESDGQEVPCVGVRKGDDGIYYWTLDGEWLLDSKGNKLAVSGLDVESGQNAVEPRLKLNGNNWSVSYDGGKKWNRISTKATSGVTFSSVDSSNPDYVIIILSDGTELRLPTWEAFITLQKQVKQLNINLSALSRIISAIQDNDYLVSIAPFIEDGVQVGWLLNFSKSGLVVIYSSPSGPVISLSGDTVPQLKIEEGCWWVSYDEGATWDKLGKATGDNGDSFFSEVDVSNDEYVRLVLADGSILTIPKYVPMDLDIDVPQDGIVIPGGFSKKIPYKITGTVQNIVYVSVLVNGDVSASISASDSNSGIVSIAMPKNSEGGTVTVMASTASGAPVVKLIPCEPLRFTAWGPDNEPRSIPTGSRNEFFNVDTEGGTITLRYKSNMPFNAGISNSAAGNGPHDWLQITHFDGGLEGTIEMKFGANDGDVNRFADVKLDFSDDYLQDMYNNCWIRIVICQPSKTFSMETSVVRAFADEFRQYEVSVSCSLDPLTLKEREEYDWLVASIWHVSREECIINVGVKPNTSSTERTGIIDVLSPKGIVLGSLTVVQEALSASDADCMVLRVLASAANDYCVYLPLMGEMDCYVDWGDGRAKSMTTLIEGGVETLSFSHRYYCSEPTEYTVKVKGKVSRMCTPASLSGYVTIISVDRWGKLGLTSMDHAFYKVATLKSIAADPMGCFSGVTTFESAFEGCSGLVTVPVSVFDNALQAGNFKRCFYAVTGVTGESPYSVINGYRVHLYERYGFPVFAPVTDSRFCFCNGNWADMEQIKLHKGWD